MTNNILNHAALLSLYDRQMRVEQIIPDARREVVRAPGGGTVVRYVRPAPAKIFINYAHLQEEEVDAAIQQQIADLRPLGQPFEWIVYDHDGPPNLSERLQAHGFRCDGPSTILALDFAEAARAAYAPLLDPVRVDVRPTSSREGLEDVIRVMEKVYGANFNWMRGRMGGHLDVPGYLSIYTAYVNDEPACAGWIYYYPNSDFAGLWGGSTVERYRGQGLYTAVLAARVQEALRRGVRCLFLDASDMSRPIVSKYGFHLLDMECSYEWEEEP